MWGQRAAGSNSELSVAARGGGEDNGNPIQCSCLENPRDRGAWWAAVYGVKQSQTRLKRLSSSSSSQGWSKAETGSCRAGKIREEAALRFPGEAKGHLASTGPPWEPHSPSRLSAAEAGGSGPLSPEERAEPPPSPSMLMYSHVPRPRATQTPSGGVPNGCKPQTRQSRLSALPPLCPDDRLGCLG